MSAEVISTNGTSICGLPQMSISKYRHTQSGLTACGGYGSERNCIKFQSGSWTTLTDNLVYMRYDHSSWVTPDEGILLIGGHDDPFNGHDETEIVYQNGTNIRFYDLKYPTE